MSARLAAAAVVMLLGVAFAGCNPFGGSADTPEPTPAPSPAATPTPTAAPAPPTPFPTPFATPTVAERAALADDLASMVLAAITEEFGEHLLEARALDLGLSDDDGSYWAVVTDGPQPVYENDGGEIINFFHIVAVYRLNTDRSWSSEIARVEIDTAPQRTGDTELVSVAPGSAWIVIRAGTGAHAGTLDVIRFDGAGGALETVLSHISSRPNAGEITDLDGDGVPEFVLNTSNPYVFCYACAVEEHSVAIHRWDGAALAEVPLQAPSGLSGDVATAAARVVSLAEADLWRQAAALAVATASRAPGEDGLRWLSILVNQNAARRLAHAGSPGQPLLTHVLAGEYGCRARPDARTHARGRIRPRRPARRRHRRGDRSRDDGRHDPRLHRARARASAPTTRRSTECARLGSPSPPPTSWTGRARRLPARPSSPRVTPSCVR